MPDENKTVDIDTSGPDIDVELETSTPETEVSIPEEKETIREASTSTQETSNEKQETSNNKTEDTEGKEDQKDELEVYSKDVQRRIAKLTKKWREAERQKEEAITYARAQKQQADSISKNILL
jgi:molecular chaperone GrpE (heat shock protein)